MSWPRKDSGFRQDKGVSFVGHKTLPDHGSSFFPRSSVGARRSIHGRRGAGATEAFRGKGGPPMNGACGHPCRVLYETYKEEGRRKVYLTRKGKSGIL